MSKRSYKRGRKDIPKVIRNYFNKIEKIKFVREMKEANKNAGLLQTSETEAIRQRRILRDSLNNK